MAQILIAKHAGACYGVERALNMVGECPAGTSSVHTLGPLIHNPGVVNQLASRGITAVETVEGLEPGSTVVIRSHGVVPQVVDRALEMGLTVVDATCPHVKKAHDAAAELASQGYGVVVVGEAGHPEVEGILARAGHGAQVIGTLEEANAAALPSKRIGVVVQTTQSQDLLAGVVAALLPRTRDLRVMNTICAATALRQKAAAELAASVDTMVVVGGKNSGNTRRLFEVCSLGCANTHHIEDVEELDASWFVSSVQIGVTAGASTPSDQIEAVVSKIRDLAGNGHTAH